MCRAIATALLFCLSSTSALAGDLVLIRHGNSQHNLNHAYNSNPNHSQYKISCLTPLGVKQAVNTAQHLLADGYNDANIARVVISPLPRTCQTSQVMMKEGLFSEEKIVVDERLIEIQAGNREGVSMDLFDDDPWERQKTSKNYNGETNSEVRTRILTLYEETEAEFGGSEQHILYITHGVPSYELIDHLQNERIRLATGSKMILKLNKPPEAI